ncbi:MAG TPA: helix-turn-helix domain-containing protein [Sporosarcina psychrophila]|uniref:Helix-turn-helix domain-containing protein n=1 Tax=Sporosarcina psychrophila TaxID=1476 RepID=A0A921KDQ4_SPOPS|nr:helix-turn-helix domain-containing protein [Sporosarcina psychrophila]
MILQTLKEVGGNKSKAASKLGIHRTTLYQKLRKYKIQ